MKAKINQRITKEEALVWAISIGVILFIAFLMHEINVLLDLVLKCQA